MPDLPLTLQRGPPPCAPAPGAENKPQQALREMFPDGTAPDVCIEAVGMHYTTSWLHWFETALKLETDPRRGGSGVRVWWWWVGGWWGASSC